MPVRSQARQQSVANLPLAADKLAAEVDVSPPGMTISKPLWLFALGLLLIVPIGCSKSSAGSAESKKPSVRVAKPLQQKVTEYVYFTGRTDAVDAVNIQSRVTGYLNSVDFEPGSEVKKDQQLFKIDPRPYKATLDEALGQVKLSEARLELATADLARAKEVARTPGAISKQDLDKYAAAQSEASASVEASKANAEAATLNLEFTSIISPIDGRVGRNLLTIGNLVKQDTTLLTSVVSQDPMFAYFNVDEHTMLHVQELIRAGKIHSVRAGAEMPIQMGLANEGNRYPHEGKIDFVNNRIDPSTGTLQVRGTIPNPVLDEHGARLFSPGLFVRVRVPLGAPFDALLIPQAAINTDQGQKYLLVVNAEGKVEYRPITLGPEQPGGLQVMVPVKMVKTEEGLQVADEDTPADAPTFPSLTANDRVIISGLQMVRPGMKADVTEINIKPRPVPMPASTDLDSSREPSVPAKQQAPSAPQTSTGQQAPAAKSEPTKVSDPASETKASSAPTKPPETDSTSNTDPPPKQAD